MSPPSAHPARGDAPLAPYPEHRVRSSSGRCRCASPPPSIAFPRTSPRWTRSRSWLRRPTRQPAQRRSVESCRTLPVSTLTPGAQWRRWFAHRWPCGRWHRLAPHASGLGARTPGPATGFGIAQVSGPEVAGRRTIGCAARSPGSPATPSSKARTLWRGPDGPKRAAGPGRRRGAHRRPRCALRRYLGSASGRASAPEGHRRSVTTGR